MAAENDNIAKSQNRLLSLTAINILSDGRVITGDLPSGPSNANRVLSTALAIIVQELCESRGGRPELSVLTSLLVSVDVKLY